ncbi:hypothetical protein Leryth_019920 [Lithospermum erythrorhizon]|nr:hypothetical protein Leryth_019920 [Lithospermum erythrorhizon]
MHALVGEYVVSGFNWERTVAELVAENSRDAGKCGKVIPVGDNIGEPGKFGESLPSWTKGNCVLGSVIHRACGFPEGGKDDAGQPVGWDIKDLRAPGVLRGYHVMLVNLWRHPLT